VKEIRKESLIESWHPFVPPRLANAIQGASVRMVLVLEPSPHHLVRVCQCSRYQLAACRHTKVLPRTLQQSNTQSLYVSSIFYIHHILYDKSNQSITYLGIDLPYL
jgi:hypothetical protein